MLLKSILGLVITLVLFIFLLQFVDINQIKEGTATITADDLSALKEAVNTFIFDILGLVNVSKDNTDSDKLSGAVELLINLRQEARANKDFALSDKIRDELAEAGILLQDGKDGTSFTVN